MYFFDLFKKNGKIHHHFQEKKKDSTVWRLRNTLQNVSMKIKLKLKLSMLKKTKKNMFLINLQDKCELSSEET